MPKATMKKSKKTLLNDSGFASLVIAFVMIIVLSLVTLAFAQLGRREQRSALDRQLAKQAYYAAESGINDAYSDIKSGKITTGTNNTDGVNCLRENDVPSTALTRDHDVNSTDAVSYTCLLLNLTPPDLQKPLPPGESWTTTFSTDNNMDTIIVKWYDNKTGHNTPRSTTSGFPKASEWGDSPGVLQLTITPLTAIDRSSLINRSSTTYLYPSSSGPTSRGYATGSNQAGFVGRCSSGTCTASITAIPGGSGPFLLRITNYYTHSFIVVTATGGGIARKFVDAQAKIDVTGRARNVLKRLQVRTPLNSPLDLPNYALEVGDICKREQTEPSGTQFIDPSSNSPTTSEPCNLSL